MFTKARKAFMWVPFTSPATIAVLIGVILSFSSETPAATIQWTPQSLTEEVAIGQTKTVTVTFTSSDAIKSAIIRVVPELQPYLQVTPSSFSNITKDQKVALKITFSPSNAAKPGTFDGTIQLRDRGTIAKPLPVKLSIRPGGGDLPPDPGEAGKQTLSGVDVNGNGLRDDLEIFISQNYGSSQKTRLGLTQFATTQQQAILSQAREQSLDVLTDQGRALECLRFLGVERNAWQKVAALAINTPERYKAWAAHEARLSGAVFASRDIRDWKASCTFNPDALPN